MNFSLPVLVVNRVAEFRKRYGYTQTDLANMVCCTKNTISLIELGKQCPTLDLAFCIASVFDESVDVIFQPSCEEAEYGALDYADYEESLRQRLEVN